MVGCAISLPLKNVALAAPPKDVAARRSCDEDAVDDPRTDWILALLTSFSFDFEVF